MFIINRNRAYYRHHRKRAINRKLDIVRNAWHSGESHPWVKEPGRLDKERMCCSCYMCKYEKNFDVTKTSYRKRLEAMDREIVDYLNGDY
ncbi:hypothetical protein [Halobacillus salinus]|uniref:Uncharacterized protein n=1 Tax=Halobacillus salinus TaxID=192814 RepID=A0A4Z0GZ40_9BACI|nr:hypothetical protein [Halobacillus salinus]TGB03492.1 hypothetical protein E4663_00345 [Halobacillus salinus]